MNGSRRGLHCQYRSQIREKWTGIYRFTSLTNKLCLNFTIFVQPYTCRKRIRNRKKRVRGSKREKGGTTGGRMSRRSQATTIEDEDYLPGLLQPATSNLLLLSLHRRWPAWDIEQKYREPNRVELQRCVQVVRARPARNLTWRNQVRGARTHRQK